MCIGKAEAAMSVNGLMINRNEGCREVMLTSISITLSCSFRYLLTVVCCSVQLWLMWWTSHLQMDRCDECQRHWGAGVTLILLHNTNILPNPDHHDLVYNVPRPECSAVAEC